MYCVILLTTNNTKFKTKQKTFSTTVYSRPRVKTSLPITILIVMLYTCQIYIYIYYVYIFSQDKIHLVSRTEEVWGGKTVGGGECWPLHHIPKCSPDSKLQTQNLDLFKLTAALVEQTATCKILNILFHKLLDG